MLIMKKRGLETWIFWCVHLADYYNILRKLMDFKQAICRCLYLMKQMLWCKWVSNKLWNPLWAIFPNAKLCSSQLLSMARFISSSTCRCQTLKKYSYTRNKVLNNSNKIEDHQQQEYMKHLQSSPNTTCSWNQNKRSTLFFPSWKPTKEKK